MISNPFQRKDKYFIIWVEKFAGGYKFVRRRKISISIKKVTKIHADKEDDTFPIDTSTYCYARRMRTYYFMDAHSGQLFLKLKGDKENRNPKLDNLICSTSIIGQIVERLKASKSKIYGTLIMAMGLAGVIGFMIGYFI